MTDLRNADHGRHEILTTIFEYQLSINNDYSGIKFFLWTLGMKFIKNKSFENYYFGHYNLIKTDYFFF